LALRLAGLGVIAVGAVALRILYRRVHLPPQHETTFAEFCLAAIGFIGVSFGSGLAALGRHIRDRVSVSPRWATTQGELYRRPRQIARISKRTRVDVDEDKL
jgi:hypothetical protein